MANACPLLKYFVFLRKLNFVQLGILIWAAQMLLDALNRGHIQNIRTVVIHEIAHLETN